MTTNKKDSTSEKKSRVKVGKLQVNKETIKDLTDKEAEQVKGGLNRLSGPCVSGTCVAPPPPDRI
jgi:hypothetical protein